ncbi:uncharacterized protein LOC113351193 [Papaver somniferum]|uniref:uncharacterized protein LOC113351193 n=1 Tax=Papaver somniferum TaxID=3469 RepID=UPI000E6FFC0D|nr:uncharacterized protein LOC113351193 [Papaver somniferum]
MDLHPRRESEGTFEFGSYSKEADDLHSVVMYFSGLKQVIGGILGHGKATVVSISAHYYMDKGIEEVLGKDYMERIKEKGFLDFIGGDGTQYRVTEESLMERLGTDMHALCLSIAPDCSLGFYQKILGDFLVLISAYHITGLHYHLSLNGRSFAQSSSVIVEEQTVIVKNKYGENLVGVLHETGSTKIVILCHGFRSSKDTPINTNLVEALTKQGISVFRFDFSGTGKSEGTQHDEYIKEADDLRSVVLHFIGMKRVIDALVGHSKGGNVVLIYASKYHDVATLVNVSGRYNMEGGIAKRLGENYKERIEQDGFIDVEDKKGNCFFSFTAESLMERLAIDMGALCLSIGKDCRVLTVHSAADKIVPVEDAYEFAKVIVNHKLQVVERADHGYNNDKHLSELAEIVVGYINELFMQTPSPLQIVVASPNKLFIIEGLVLILRIFLMYYRR